MADVLKAAYLRAAAVDYLKHFIGLPYLWSGDDPMAGFDCSGLMVEVLQAVGLIPHRSDFSAPALYKRFEAGAVARGYAGCLVFWLADDRVIHVEMMVDDLLTIGASGGGSATLTEGDAIEANAYVKMRPVGYRGQTYLVIDPFMADDRGADT